MQDLGHVVAKEGRLVTFPNTIQHRVEPFELADKTKPGHRKIVALFLVDPNIRIISTADVPPQQADWWLEKVAKVEKLLASRLPAELITIIMNYAMKDAISLKEAKALRLELMDERTAPASDRLDPFYRDAGEFSLCEH